MGICPGELRSYVIKPTLLYLEEYSAAAEQLLLVTAAVESDMGFHLMQNEEAGLGVYRITPRTHQAVWDKYLAFQPELASKVRGLASQREFLLHPHAELATNLSYATAIAWMLYRRLNKPLPDPQDPLAMADFWHSHFRLKATHSIDDFMVQHRICLPASYMAA